MQGKVLQRNFLSSTPMSAPSSLRSFITPAKMQGADVAAVTVPDIKATLLAEEQQVQWDTDDLVEALEDMNHKQEELANKRRDVQAAQEKRKADAKVRGKLLTNAVVAEVWRRFVCQADKARLVAEKLQVERDMSRSPRKVRMKLGVSNSLFSSSLEAEKSVGNRCAHECSGRIVEAKGM